MAPATSVKSLTAAYDLVRDVVTIEGVNYAADLFRQLAARSSVGNCFRIQANGVTGDVGLQRIDCPRESTPLDAALAGLMRSG